MGACVSIVGGVGITVVVVTVSVDSGFVADAVSGVETVSVVDTGVPSGATAGSGGTAGSGAGMSTGSGM